MRTIPDKRKLVCIVTNANWNPYPIADFLVDTDDTKKKFRSLQNGNH